MIEREHMKPATPNGGIRIMRRETPINDASSDAKSEASSVTTDGAPNSSKDGSGSARMATTLEERTAAYEEARKRIFKDFPESSVSGSDDEKDRDDEDGRGSSGGSDRKTTNTYAADDEDFPRRSQYVPLGSGYYHVYDRNAYTPQYGYMASGPPPPPGPHSAPNSIGGNGNDNFYNNYGRPPYGQNAITGHNVARTQIAQQQYPGYGQKPPQLQAQQLQQQAAYQQGSYQHYLQNGYQGQPEVYGGIEAQNGQRRNYNQYQQPVQPIPYGTQRPPYLGPVSSPQQSTYGATAYPQYPQYPQQPVQAQYAAAQQAAQQQLYIPPDQLQQTASYKYQQQQQQQFLPRFGPNSHAYSAVSSPAAPVSVTTAKQAVYQQMPNLSIRPMPTVTPSNNNNNGNNNGNLHGFNKYGQSQVPFQQKFYSPKQQYVPYPQQSVTQHPHQPSQQVPLPPESQPNPLPSDPGKPAIESLPGPGGEPKTESEGLGANVKEDASCRNEAQPDQDTAAPPESVSSNDDGELAGASESAGS
ncbi:hypothetical protein V1509DRAFT_623019 [Lipomyces kononenkoae]